MAIKDAVHAILDNVNIIDVISQDTHLAERANHEYLGSCPFHVDKNPSFTVNSDKQVFHCFSCGRSGNVITYVKEKYGYSFFDAIKYLADEYNISLNGVISAEDQELSAKRKAYYELMNLAQEYFVQQLNNHQKELDYLLNIRKLDKDTIEKFGIGFDDGKLYQYLSSEKGYLMEELSNNGLVKLDNVHNKVYDFFEQRITFPIKDKYGHIIAYSARTLDKNNPAKYKNSVNNSFFNKNQVLYNQDAVINYLKNKDKKSVYLFEGQNDVISAVASGKQNSVASLGTSLTDNQIVNLINLADEVIISYDGDAAGHKAILRAANNLKVIDPDIQLSIIQLPDGLDPDDYRRKYDTEKLNNELSQTIPIIEYLIKLKFQDFQKNTKQTISDRSKLYKDCQAIIYHYANNIEQAMYLEQLNKTFHINKEVATKEIKKYEDNQKHSQNKHNFDNSANGQTKEVKNTNSNPTIKTSIEDKLLSYILNNEFNDENYKLLAQYFKNEVYNKIILSLISTNNIQLDDYSKAILEQDKNLNINFSYQSFIDTLKQMYITYDQKKQEQDLNTKLQKAIEEKDTKKIIELSRQKILQKNSEINLY